MIRLTDRIFGLSLERIWFWDGTTPITSRSSVLRYLRLTPQQAEGLRGCSDVAYTLLTDLTRPEEELWSALNKNYRYEIRRAQKEETQISFYSAAALRQEPALLEEMESVYMNFCDALGNQELKKDYDKNKVASYVEHDCIMLTRAVCGGAVVFHLYVTDGETAVLCYSASDFRNADVDQAMAGRMNKLLHWQDMMHMKEAGVQLYDWGNVSSLTEYNGIDRFKAGFGGEQATLTSVFVGNTLLGKAAVLAKQILQNRKGSET